MIKKISAVILALILCLSVMVVPVSAGAELNGTKVAFALEWDKEYYQPGDTATLYLYLALQDDVELNSGSITLALNSAFISPDDNDPASCVSSCDVFSSFFKDITSNTAKSATAYQTKIENANTEEENATYDWYIKTSHTKNASGDHENCANNLNGLPGSEIDPTEPWITYTFTVSESAEDGATIPAALTSGATQTNPQQIGFKYYSYPGEKSTTAWMTSADYDVSVAIATATIGTAPCEVHTWDDGVVTTEAGCNTEGVMTYTCSVCKSTKTEAIAATGNHTASDTIVKENEVAASCSTNGSYDAVTVCAVCGTEISRETVSVPSTGEHVYATVVSTVDPTCLADGSVTKACACGAEDVTVIPATGHSYSSSVVAPTCTEDGYTLWTCACGDNYKTDETDALGHSYDDGVVTTEATCTVDGVMTYTCTCGDTYTEAIDATGHTEVADDAVAPTCTATGLTAGSHCSVCSEVLVAQTEVAATGHAYELTFTKAATCTREGYYEYTCSVCTDRYRETIAAKGHTPVAVEGKEPTCLSAGYTAYEVCSVCNTNVTAKTTIPATGHTKVDGVVTAPTYTSRGYTTYVCPVCNVEFKDDYTNQLVADFTLNIKEPSITEIRCKDTIVLHAEVTGNPQGLTLVWSAENEKLFKTNDLGDGDLEITSKKNGTTVFTVSLVDADGNVYASDTVEMTSKANFFQQIGGFFRSLFGSTKYYAE